MLKVKLIHPAAKVPKRATPGAAGFDLYAIERRDIPPGAQAALPIGLSVAIPHGWYGRIAPRSGLAVRHMVNVHAGVIDCDYRGELAVCLINHGTDLLEILPGDRIAQLIIERCSMDGIEVVEELDDTDRGTGGFGSTGLRG